MSGAYCMLADSDLEPRATKGTVVYDLRGHDYGLASDDTRHTGIPHVSVTLDPNGGYPSFTVPKTALVPVEGLSVEPPDDEHVDTVCRVGQGHDCCRYLTMSAGGWSCEKRGPLAATLDARVRDGTINARGDNCEGRGSR